MVTLLNECRSFHWSSVAFSLFPCLTLIHLYSRSAVGQSWHQAAPSCVRQIPRPWAQPGGWDYRRTDSVGPAPLDIGPISAFGSLACHNETSMPGMWESVPLRTPTSTSSAPPASPSGTSSLAQDSSTTPLHPPSPSRVSSRQQARTSQLNSCFFSQTRFILSEAWYHWRSWDKKQILPMTARQIYRRNARAPVSLCTDLIESCDAPPLTARLFYNDAMLLWVIGISLIPSTRRKQKFTVQSMKSLMVSHFLKIKRFSWRKYFMAPKSTWYTRLWTVCLDGQCWRSTVYSKDAVFSGNKL